MQRTDTTTKEGLPHGRVVIWEYYPDTDSARPYAYSVHGRELLTPNELSDFYVKCEANPLPILRIIYARNAPWMTSDLIERLSIDKLGGRFGKPNFADWIAQTSGTILSGQAAKAIWWAPEAELPPTSMDPTSDVVRSGFGFDYFTIRDAGADTPPPPVDHRDGVIHLRTRSEGLDDDVDDLLVRRASVYVQRCIPLDNGERAKEDGSSLPIRSVARCNTILIATEPVSNRPELASEPDDGLLLAFNAHEVCWSNLSYLARDESINNFDYAANKFMNKICSDIMNALADTWDDVLELAKDHVELVQDRFHVDPTDDSGAPGIWKDQANWAHLDKILSSHWSLVSCMQPLKTNDMEIEGLDENGDPEMWLAKTESAFEHLAESVSENLVAPTATISDQMYKAIAYKDARESLQLNLSLWRLSWITFIFLPLTCLSDLPSTHTCCIR